MQKCANQVDKDNFAFAGCQVDDSHVLKPVYHMFSVNVVHVGLQSPFSAAPWLK